MYNVKIYGAGSIGNHLAHGCRSKGWPVLMCDLDQQALERTRDDIYPSRYGQWDPQIRLATPDNLPDEDFDLIIIGTPPDSHMALARSILETKPPRALLIEKPLCTPSLQGAQEIVELQAATGTFVAVGYNHTLTQNSQRAAQILADNAIGRPLTLSARFREHWGGIFGAHPWLSGPQDTYLGFFERGGGASGEHSHAMNIWQHFAHLAGQGRITEVSAALDIVDDGTVKYDRVCLLNVKTESGFVGNIAQDVVTEPAEKSVRIQGSQGYLEWLVNVDAGNDAVRYGDGTTEAREELIPKSRPDDFKGEIDHIAAVLDGEFSGESPISLQRGLDTMLVVAATHISHREKRTVHINYDNGYRLDAIETA
ncbi:MAG: Gfo/Idh/MocA family oxidoreductase [Deltaproteobacteria bacterium]|nr:Gfo/Idh/MocA family oxidoreductase [Deltaproteobacteria bacterium]